MAKNVMGEICGIVQTHIHITTHRACKHSQSVIWGSVP